MLLIVWTAVDAPPRLRQETFFHPTRGAQSPLEIRSKFWAISALEHTAGLGMRGWPGYPTKTPAGCDELRDPGQAHPCYTASGYYEVRATGSLLRT